MSGEPASVPNASTALPAGQVVNTPDPTASGIFEWNYSGKSLRARCLLTWAITILLIVLGVFLTMSDRLEGWLMPLWGIIVVVLALCWGYFFCIYWYRTQTITYRLSEHRLEKIEGIFTRLSDPLELLYIEDLRLELRLVDRLINGGVGRIIIFSTVDKTDAKLVIDGVENPREVYERLDAARCRIRAKRGFITT